MLTALRKDGDLYKPGRIAEVIGELLSVVVNVGPYMLRSLLPWHDPRDERDPQWMKDWVAGHARLPAGTPLPLVDTKDPELPVPFGVSPASQPAAAAA